MKQSTAKATAFCADCGMCLDEAELLAKENTNKGLPKIETAYIGTDCFY